MKLPPFVRERWSLVLVALVVVLVAGFLLYQAFKPEGVLAYRTERDDVLATLTVTGEVHADYLAGLSPVVTAKIREVRVDEGDLVGAGQVVAELDEDDVRAGLIEQRARLAQAQAGLEVVREGAREEEEARLYQAWQEALAAVEETREALASAHVQQEAAQRRAERFGELYAGEFISEEELEEATDQLAVTQSEIDRLEALVNVRQRQAQQTRLQYEQAVAGPIQAEIEEAAAARRAAAAAVEGAAELLENRFVRSSAPGIVLERLQDPGEVAQPGQAIVRVADPATLEILALVEEMDLSRVQVGDEVVILFDAAPDAPVAGEVTEIGDEVDPQTGTVEVTVIPELDDLREAGVRMLPGMTVDVNIVTARLQDALVVPVTAVQRESGRYLVYVFAFGGLRQRPVDVERISLEYMLVLDGLEPGETVARFADVQLLERRNVSPMLTPLESDEPIRPGG